MCTNLFCILCAFSGTNDETLGDCMEDRDTSSQETVEAFQTSGCPEIVNLSPTFAPTFEAP